MRTFWSFSALVRVKAGGHRGFPAGSEFCVQCLVAPRMLDDALPELRRFLKQENLVCLDIFIASRFDLDDEDEEIADYLRGDAEQVVASNNPVISVYITSEESTAGETH